MNYRHIYHAGHICDVVKHAILVLLLGHLRQKAAAFAVLDTHAGIGWYDLTDPRARRTGEAQTGIGKLLTAPSAPLLQDYAQIVADANGGMVAPDDLTCYPGSPWFTARMLRPQDRLMACELHPEDFETLAKLFAGNRQVQVHHRDGYEAMGALLPPPEKRGLVLIDPPFEKPDEFSTLAQHIAKAHHRWPTGIYAVWYPVKDRPAIWSFHEAMVATGLRKQLVAEFLWQSEERADRLNGTGMLIINPPWQMDEKISTLLSGLQAVLGEERIKEPSRVAFLSP